MGIEDLTQAKQLALGSILIGLVVLGIKAVAWSLTGSVALYSDALESSVNVVAAIVAYAALSYAARPADRNHPYGHSKAEYFSAVIEGVMIIIAAFLIFAQAFSAFKNPQPIDLPVWGVGISLISTAINWWWSRKLTTRGRVLHSPALIADGKHLLADVVTSLGVVIGILVVMVTGLQIFDPIIACAVGGHILWSGWKVFASSISGLMDEAVDEESLQLIRETIAKNAKGAIEFHDLKTRQAGALTYIDFHLVVDGEATVSESHEICDRVEQALRDILPHAQIHIHVEPNEKAHREASNIL